MKLRSKLLLGTFALAVSLWPVAWYSERTSRSALEELLMQRTARQAGDILEETLRVGTDRLRELHVLVQQPSFRHYLHQSNAEYALRDNAMEVIAGLDKEWRETPAGTLSPAMVAALDTDCSTALKAYLTVVHEEQGYPVFGELFVTNRLGANVGQSGLTSDFLQSDEQWWQSAAHDGVYLGEPKLDESAGVISTDLCIRVQDGRRELIGVLKAVLDIRGIINVLDAQALANDARLTLYGEGDRIIYDTEGSGPEALELALFVDSDVGDRNTQMLHRFRESDSTETVAALARRHGAETAALNWKVVVETPTEGVLEPSRRLGRKIRLAAWLVTIAGTLLGLFLSLTIARRVDALHGATAKIKAGEYSYRLPDCGNDELGDLAESFNEMASELECAQRGVEAAQRAKDAFLANMSHEIRTPITAILGAVDMLVQPEMGEHERIDHFQTVRTSSQHLVSLINGILDLSKIEAAKLTVENVACSPALIAQEVVELLSHQAIAKNLQLHIQFDSAVPASMDSDPTRIRQILVNLVGNAIKFTSLGTVTICLAFEAGPGPRLIFRVIDTGIGITEEQIGSIFRPFEQADTSTSRLFGGTGLGLTISRKLARALGGDLVARSGVAGSSFTLTIMPTAVDPDRLIDRVEDIVQSQALDSLAESANLEGVRVLLAEDVPLNRKLIAAMLSSAKVDVTVAENGRVAVDRVYEAEQAGKPFDLILMDLMMPELDGWGATQALRESGYIRPIVAFTADALRETSQRCLSAGFNEVVTKPIRRAALIEVVRLHAQPAEEGLRADSRSSVA